MLTTDQKTLNMILGGGKPAKKTRKPSAPRIAKGKRIVAWGDTFGAVVSFTRDTVEMITDAGDTKVFAKTACRVA